MDIIFFGGAIDRHRRVHSDHSFLFHDRAFCRYRSVCDQHRGPLRCRCPKIAHHNSLVVGLRVHPFIITLGSMWILRGVAFVATKAESILLPHALTAFTKASLGLSGGLYPVPCCS